jgi:hypothetical protein
MEGLWSSLATPDRDKPHDLRLTARCRRDDLVEDGAAGLDELAARHDVVRHFLELRRDHPGGDEPVDSLPADLEVYALRRTEKVGATWHDVTQHIVWLLALTGAEADSFAYFASLHASSALMPSNEDYEDVTTDQITRLAPAVIVELRGLLSMAQDANGSERAYVLIDGTIARLVVQCQGEEITEVWIALRPRRETPMRPGHLLGALMPEASEDHWDQVRRLPHRKLEADERAFRYRPRGGS